MKTAGTIIIGLAIIVTTIDPIMIKLICIPSKIAFDKYSSVEPISFEKRFMILPDGFRLKNLIEVEINPLNMALCSFSDAIIHKRENLTDLVMAIRNRVAKIIP